MSVLNKFIKNEITGWKSWELIWLAISTLIIAGLSIYWGDNWFGITSALTGVWCVILTGKGKVTAFIVGLVNTLMYAWIAYNSKYYGEVMLNALYYAPMQFVGFYAWSKHMNEETHEVDKKRMNVKQLSFWVVVACVSVVGYGYFLKSLGGNLPYFDAFTTCLSVIAMIVSVKRYMEQWVLWIFIDIVTVYLWYMDYALGNDNVATLLMWVVYLLNAVFQLVKWYKDSKVENVILEGNK